MKFLATAATALFIASAASGAHAVAPTSFAQCSACHAVKKGVNGVGPSLAGVFGHAAGGAAGFSYSPALKASHKIWNAAALDKWLTNPASFVPGSRMPYAGMSDAHQRAEVIAYLKTLK
jgi:cytochrome c